MPEPFTAREQYIGSTIGGLGLFQHETPVIVHIAHQSTLCQANCIAFHDDKSLNVISKSRPPFSTPSEYYNSWSRMLCIAQCLGTIYPGEHRDQMFKVWNFQLLPTNEEVISCEGNPTCLEDVVKANDYDPRLIGQIVAHEIEVDLKEDGWNSHGTLSYDPERDSVAECTANCAPYSDTTGYFPRNNPHNNFNSKTKYQKKRTLKRGGGKKKQQGGNDKKYEVNGNNKYWQPLRELTPYLGTVIRQEHVTPHIGIKAKPTLLTSFKKAKDPKYDYKMEADLLLERLRELTGDVRRQDMVKFFDNKILVRVFIQVSLMAFFKDELTFEDYMMYDSGISSAEIDATIQVWREKVRHDLVRPPTVIQAWNNDVIETFNDEVGATSPKALKARDFQPYIRTMPHSEYPSGSASICTAYAGFVDLFTQEYFGTDLPLLSIGNATTAFNTCEGDFPFGIGCTSLIDLEDMAELASLCGQSRLWAGLHFSSSVTAGEEIVSGLGKLAFDFVKTIKADSNWTNTITQMNAEESRPKCAN